MANINSQWKRFVAIGCSHGHLANPDALKAVLKFTAKYKPHTRVHLGDFIDTAAFRAGARGTNDEGVSVENDLRHGLTFLREFRPTNLVNGNHEIRLWNAAHSPNAILAQAAMSVIREIRGLTDKLKCDYIEHYEVHRSWFTLGDTKFLHGFMFNEHAIRDHAETYGRCVLAHLHVVGEAAARRTDGARGYCVGTLADVPSMAYALTRRATLRWSHGISWGEFSSTHCHINLSECPAGQADNWRLPL